MREEVLLQMMETHRLLRHDFMNHLQIILGYMQLGKMEKAQEYTVKATRDMRKYENITKWELPYLGCFLTGFIAYLSNDDKYFQIALDEEICFWNKDDKELTQLMIHILNPLKELFYEEKLHCIMEATKETSPYIRLNITKKVLDFKLDLEYIKEYISDRLSVKIDEVSPQLIQIMICRTGE